MFLILISRKSSAILPRSVHTDFILSRKEAARVFRKVAAFAQIFLPASTSNMVPSVRMEIEAITTLELEEKLREKELSDVADIVKGT